MKNKNILIIETSLARIMVSIIKKKNVYIRSTSSQRSIEQDINQILSQLIIDAGVEFNDLSLILVSLGPGSFTGIRIGISVAKAISISTGIKIQGFSNYQSIFCQFLTTYKEKKFDKINVLIKGPGDEFFKRTFCNNKFERKSYVITLKDLKEKKLEKNCLYIGNFLNKYNLRNYFFCLPNKFGIQNMLTNKSYDFKKSFSSNLSPLYVKEHYAKK